MDMIPLSDMLAELRKALRTAQKEAKQSGDIWFLVEDIDLELQVIVSKDANGKAELKIPGFTAGGGGGVSQETVQKVRLKLGPRGADKQSRVHTSDKGKF
jgi:hypothetical protein